MIPSRCCPTAGGVQSQAAGSVNSGSGFSASGSGADWSKNPWNSAPPGWREFNAFGSVTVAAGATEIICSETLNAREFARITHFAQGLSSTAGWADCTWRILVNGVPLSNYDSVQDQLGETGPMTLVGIKVALELATIEVEITNNGASSYNAFARLFGYSFDSRLAEGY